MVGLNAESVGHRNAWWASDVTSPIGRAPIGRAPIALVMQGLHFQRAQVLLPQPLLLSPFHASSQIAAEATQQHNEPPDKPKASKAGEEGVGAVGHHHLYSGN